MKLAPLTLVAAFAVLPTHALAECGKGSTVVFSCTTSKGKVIEVCDAKDTIDYSYGLARAKPELVIRAPRASASTSQWAGVGSWMSYAVDIPNGSTTYSVFWGVDRMNENHPIEAGVNVIIKGKQAATVKCAADKPITQNIEGIDLKPTE